MVLCVIGVVFGSGVCVEDGINGSVGVVADWGICDGVGVGVSLVDDC